ncbi:MAG: sodium/proton-translocating pyrophosphatase [Nitrosarchaeum sp.]|nr:sodium/proton-translocating pyrophosphatase [Nitrosarchaeum sp.]
MLGWMSMYIELVFFVAVLALGYTAFLSRSIRRFPAGTERMVQIAGYIRKGAMAFLRRQYLMLAVFVVVVAAALYGFIGQGTALAFVCGAVASALAGVIGMRSATTAAVRAANAARKDINTALQVAFRSGSVMGLAVVGLGLLGISVLFVVFGVELEFSRLEYLLGFSFGASSIALFARVGGGIFTKAADVGADLVGKVEAGIPEDDPRNPATIADNVGDNVGDVAGMGADLFESYVGSIISAMILGAAAFAMQGRELQMNAVLFPLLVAAVGVVASVIGSFCVRAKSDKDVGAALRNGLVVSSVLVAVGILALSRFLLGGYAMFWAAFAGLLGGVLIGLLTEYYTSSRFAPTRGISKASLTGSATNLIEGLAVGMKSTALPVIVLVASIGVAFYFGGLYGIAIAALGIALNHRYPACG